MALVRYNRNYTVQSGPRQPARRNPGALPDAAGAFLRGASGIHEGDMAVGRALLASNEARTKRELARAADAGRHWQEAGRIVAAAGKGLGEIADAYQRAQARRLRDEIEKGEADFGMDLAEKAPSIMATKAVVSSKEGADASITDGRAIALGKFREDFENSDAFTKLSDEAKEVLRRRMKARMIPYMAKANELDHRQLADDRQRNLARSFDSLKAGMDMNLGTDETERAAWDDALSQVKVKAASIIRQKAGIDDIGPDGGAITGTPTKEQQDEIERLVGDTVRGLRTERLKHWFAQLENPDADADALKDAIGGEINKDNFPSDAARLALERARDASVKRRDANVAAALARDNALADGIADKIGMGTATEEETKQYNAICAKLPDADKAAREATRQHAAEFREWQDWAQTYIAMIPTGEGATLEATLGAIGTARREAARLSPRAQSLAEKSLLPFRPAEDEYGKMCVGAIDELCSLGIWNGQDVDLRRTRDILTDAVESGIIDARKFESLFSAAQRSAEARAARADAMPGPGTGEEFQRIMRRYLPDSVVEKYTHIDVKNHALTFTDQFDESGSYDTPEKRADRSNAILSTMVNAMTRFYALQAQGRLKPEQTLDSFVADIMTNNEDYKKMTDEAVIDAYKKNIQSLENAAALEDARRINPYFGTQYAAPRFDLLPPKRQ